MVGKYDLSCTFYLTTRAVRVYGMYEMYAYNVGALHTHTRLPINKYAVACVYFIFITLNECVMGERPKLVH